MALKDPSRDSYFRLTFTQAGVEYKFVDWTETVSGYMSLPGLSLTLPPNVGTLDEKLLTLEFERGLSAFLDAFVSGAPCAPTVLKVEEVFVSQGPINTSGCAAGVAQSINLGNTWRLTRGVRNPEGRAGVARLEFSSIKARMNVPLGIAATPNCAWTFGDKTCQYAVVEETAVIAAISRKKITLTDPDDITVVDSKHAGYWHQGVATVAGLSIAIRDWANDSYDFQLRQEPPSSWLGATVTLRPGCNNTKANCTLWGNLARFGGFGIKIPAKHPNTEVA